VVADVSTDRVIASVPDEGGGSVPGKTADHHDASPRQISLSIRGKTLVVRERLALPGRRFNE
jgi:hypothetical protein